MSPASWSPGARATRLHGARLIDAVYGELRRLARGYLQRERPDHSLPPTALVHEAYLKLVDQRRVQWQNRTQFFAIAAHLMRRILVDHARAHNARKRGAGARVPLEDRDVGFEPLTVDVVALDLALQRLAENVSPPESARGASVLRRADGRGDCLGAGPGPNHGQARLGAREGWLYRELQGQVA